MLISDINTAGASGDTIVSTGGLVQILLNGTWNGATVNIEKQIADDSWRTIASFTDNDFYIVESVGSAKYRTNTTHDVSAPDLVCDVTFASSQAGRVEAA